MKMKTLFAVVVTAILFTLMSCKTSPKDMLVKKWKPSDITAPGITPDLKSKFLAGDNYLEFMKDGKYASSANGAQSEKGAYTLSEDSKTVTMNSEKGQTNTISVKELTKDRMVGDVTGATITFVPYTK